MANPTNQQPKFAGPTRDPKVQKKADEVLSSARYIARQRTPYFTGVLLKLVMRPDWELSMGPGTPPGSGTLAVSASGIMRYQPDFVARFTPKQVAGALVHECMHLVLRHHERCGMRDPAEFNKAGDRAINPGVIQCGLELPTAADFKPLFPADIKMADGLSADDYYQPPREGDSGGGGHGPGSGGCGGCSGNPLPDEDGDGADPAARSPAEMSRAAKESAEAMRDAAQKNPGSVPSNWARAVGDLLVPPVVPWQTKLSRAVRAACAYRPGAVVHKFDAPSRRQSGIGFGAGKPILPRYRQPVPQVDVEIDTSGSMGTSELTEAAVEIQGILRAVGAAVTYGACDAEMHAEGRASRVEQIIAALKGGGGTDFRPIFESLKRKRPRPEVVVVCTDGYGPAPAAPPKGMTVIWLLVGRNVTRPATWGECIAVNPDVVLPDGAYAEDAA